ncbi:MAG: hypothetical protein K6E29_00930 [Cyanobacteria bacterium RUI128]|nr:hypothetical protein [Cyanobacteria bacterium RUI128]
MTPATPGAARFIIDGGFTNAASKSITQKEVQVTANATALSPFTNNGSITATTFTNSGYTNNVGTITAAITNNGNLTSSASNLSGTITNDGTLNLNGGVNGNVITTTVANSVVNLSGVTQNDAKITAKEITNSGNALVNTNGAKLTGDITNTGVMTANAGDLLDTDNNILNTNILLLSGTLQNTISGNGTTKINSALTFGNSAAIQGDFDFNNGTLTMTPGVVGNNNVGRVVGNGNLNIDLNLTGATADTLTVTNQSSGLITLTGVNILDPSTTHVATDFSVDILKNVPAGSTVGLALSSDVAAQFDANQYIIEEEPEKVVTDSVKAVTNWISDFYKKHTTSALTVFGKLVLRDDGLGLAVAETSRTGGVTTDTSLGETLKLVNQDVTNSVKRFEAQTDGQTYTISDSLGGTKGTLTVAGIAGGSVETLDLNGNSGFELGDSDSVLILSDLTIGGKDVVANVTDGSARVDLNNTVLNGSVIGTTNFAMTTNGDTQFNASVENAAITNSGTLTTSAENVSLSTVNNSGVLKLTGGNLSNTVSGTGDVVADTAANNLTVSGNVSGTNFDLVSGNVNLTADDKLSNFDAIRTISSTTDDAMISFKNNATNSILFKSLNLVKDLMIAIDVKLNNLTGDNFNTQSGITGANVLIKDIDINTQASDDFTKYVLVSDDSIKNQFKISDNVQVHNNSKGYVVSYVTSDTDTAVGLGGYLKFLLGNLQSAILSTTDVRAYSLAANEPAFTVNPLNMGGKQLSITGNDYTISAGAATDGIILSDDQILSISDVSSISGFTTAITVNKATAPAAADAVLNLNNVTFENNTIDIYNDGQVNFSGVNSVNNIIGTGTTNIKNGASVAFGSDADDTLTQDNLNIESNAELKISANALNVANDVTNNGDLVLTSGQLTSSVTGVGTTKFNGDVVVNGNVSNNIEISSYTQGGIQYNSDVLLKNGNTLGNNSLITINNNNKLNVENANDINSVISNDGILEIQSGNISKNISGSAVTSQTVISGNVSNDAVINQNSITVANAATGAKFANNGSVTADTISVGNNSEFTMNKDSDVTANSISVVNGKLNINDNADLSNVSNINLNSGSLNLATTINSTNDLTLSKDINGSGYAVNVSTANDNAVNIESAVHGVSSVNVATNSTLSLNDGSDISDASNLPAVITLDTNSILNVNSTTDKTFGNNVVGSAGSQVNVNTNGATSAITLNNSISGVDNVNLENGTLNIGAVNDNKTSTSATLGSAVLNIKNNSTAVVNTNSHQYTVNNNVVGQSAADKFELAGNAGTYGSATDRGTAFAFDNGVTLSNATLSIASGELMFHNADSFLGAGSQVRVNGGATLNAIDSLTSNYNSNIIFDNNSQVLVDVNALTASSDRFLNSILAAGDSVTLTDINLMNLDNVTVDYMTINLAESMNLGKITVGDDLLNKKFTALTPIRKLEASVSPDGILSIGAAGGGYGGDDNYANFNPAVVATPIAAQTGAFANQLRNYDEAFHNMDMFMLMSEKERLVYKYRNKYASADEGEMTYDSRTLRQEKPEGFIRSYATFERVPLKNGPDVNNVAYGSFIGGETPILDLGHGWDGLYGIYLGYNGSHQTYEGISIYQNGGTLGLIGMAYKGNFFTGLTVNAGAIGGETSCKYGNDNFAMLTAGVASKSGYNFEFGDGKFILQPHFQISYTFVNTFDYTNAAGVRITSDPLNIIQLEPGIKFIGNLKNGWQPYANVSVIWNLMDETKYRANNTALPSTSIKPYVKYGLGVRKTIGESFTGSVQAYATNGGRNGVGIQVGLSWLLGDNPVYKSKSNPNPKTSSSKTIKPITTSTAAPTAQLYKAKTQMNVSCNRQLNKIAI